MSAISPGVGGFLNRSQNYETRQSQLAAKPGNALVPLSTRSGGERHVALNTTTPGAAVWPDIVHVGCSAPETPAM